MLKYDSCYHMGRIGTPQISFNRFKVMSDALRATGRNILLNLCNWGEDQVHTVSMRLNPFKTELTTTKWGMSISNSWRITGDIYDSFTVSPREIQIVAIKLTFRSDRMTYVGAIRWRLAIRPASRPEHTALFYSS